MEHALVHDEKREQDVQALCEAILTKGIESTGDCGSGGQCPFCYSDCSLDASMSDVIHKPNCVYLIAKDLSTNL